MIRLISTLSLVLILSTSFIKLKKESFNSSGQFLGGVTNIKEVVNNTDLVINVKKKDFKDDYRRYTEETGEIPPNGIYSGDMWIPWATNKEEFRSHNLGIAMKRTWGPNNTSYSFEYIFLWQQGEYVRHSKDKIYTERNIDDMFVSNGPKVPGEAKAGGDRRMIVSKNGNKLAVRLEKF